VAGQQIKLVKASKHNYKQDKTSHTLSAEIAKYPKH
jgi:hypothetical protein